MPLCFAIRRGEYEGRLDCQFYFPKHRDLEQRLHTSSYGVHRVGEPIISTQVVDGPFGSDLKMEEYVEQGIPLIRVSNCRTGEIVDDDELVFISPKKHEELKRSEVLPGDVLLTKAGHILGYTAVFPSDLGKGNITSHLASIRPANGVEPQFLAVYLTSAIGISQIYRWGNKATRPELNTDEVRSLLVVLPPVDIQRKLVAEMQAAREARIQKLREADELLASLDAYLLETLGLQTLSADERAIFAVKLAQVKAKRFDPPAYRPWFAKDKPLKTPPKPLSEIALVDLHSIPKPRDPETLVPYVGLPECDLTEVREVVMRPYNEVKGRSIVKPGDILFARIEPSVFNKKYVLADDLKGHKYAYTSTEFYVVTPRESVNLHYLYAMFFCSFVFAQTKGKTTGSSGRRRLDPEMFASLQIPVPEMSTQLQIAAEVRRRREKARRLRIEADGDWQAAKRRFEQQLLGAEQQ
jgi:restriction endonuclease S subunit